MITLPVDLLGAGQIESLKTQIGKLPTEAKAQFYKLTAPNADPKMNMLFSILADGNERDSEALKLFAANAFSNKNGDYSSLYLNLSLVNHSCAPNAEEGDLRSEDETEDQVRPCELRAIKDIQRGEEINICYIHNIKSFGNDTQKRKKGIMEELTFDCACPVCSGQVADQDEIMKRLTELHIQLNPLSPDEIDIGFEKWEARIQDKIVDLTMELYIGRIEDKLAALDATVRTAQLARDQNLVKKAMDIWKKLAADTNMTDVQKTCQIMESSLSQWSKELKSRKAPKKREIEFVYNISFYD